MTLRKIAGLGALLSLALPGVALAAEEPVLNSGDTAWMLISTALVLLMTIPGLALFYGGMVRAKNVLSIMMQCFAITGLITILWVVYGYSLAFDTAGMEKGVLNFNSFVGGLDKAFLSGLTADGLTSATALFPESVFITFQMTFAIITPALIVGAFAERMKFSAMLIFMAVWFTVVYAPIAHMVWSGDGALMWDWGVLDFAGGTVVHINAGIAGLVACLVLGKRKGYPTTPMAPHNLGYTLVGAAMLWIGWFGFNAGSAAAANGTAGPMGALVIGLASGVICFFAATSLKRALKYDDSLDAFGVHAVGGIVGALLTGIFAAPSLGGFGSVEDIGAQFFVQFKGVAFTVVYTAVVTFVILKVLDLVMGLRVTEEEEAVGLDLALHNERGYNL